MRNLEGVFVAYGFALGVRVCVPEKKCESNSAKSNPILNA